MSEPDFSGVDPLRLAEACRRVAVARGGRSDAAADRQRPPCRPIRPVGSWTGVGEDLQALTPARARPRVRRAAGFAEANLSRQPGQPYHKERA